MNAEHICALALTCVWNTAALCLEMGLIIVIIVIISPEVITCQKWSYLLVLCYENVFLIL